MVEFWPVSLVSDAILAHASVGFGSTSQRQSTAARDSPVGCRQNPTRGQVLSRRFSQHCLICIHAIRDAQLARYFVLEPVYRAITSYPGRKPPQGS